mmetsp:Transcript_10129/g.14321  ORF Transcript_10129/g.14321 Transcript_10129/m.14321 type:complete len:88 (+) Transcript_10129:177-440(+)
MLLDCKKGRMATTGRFQRFDFPLSSAVLVAVDVALSYYILPFCCPYNSILRNLGKNHSSLLFHPSSFQLFMHPFCVIIPEEVTIFFF